MAGKNYNDRILASEVRTLALEDCKKVFLGELYDEEFRKALVLRFAGTLLPRLNELTGEGGEKLFTQPIISEDAKKKIAELEAIMLSDAKK